MKKKIAASLRTLANKLSPQSLTVYPLEGQLHYRGERYKLEVLNQRRYIPERDNAPEFIDHVTRSIKDSLASKAGNFVRTTNYNLGSNDQELGEESRYIESQLLVLKRLQ